MQNYLQIPFSEKIQINSGVGGKNVIEKTVYFRYYLTVLVKNDDRSLWPQQNDKGVTIRLLLCTQTLALLYVCLLGLFYFHCKSIKIKTITYKKQHTFGNCYGHPGNAYKELYELPPFLYYWMSKRPLKDVSPLNFKHRYSKRLI